MAVLPAPWQAQGIGVYTFPAPIRLGMAAKDGFVGKELVGHGPCLHIRNPDSGMLAIS